MKKLLTHLAIAMVALVMLVGTFWPDGLDWLLPSSIHYELWPIWIKVIGWLCVAGVTVADLMPHEQKVTQEKGKH